MFTTTVVLEVEILFVCKRKPPKDGSDVSSLTQHAWSIWLLYGEWTRGHKLGSRDTSQEAVVQVRDDEGRDKGGGNVDEEKCMVHLRCMKGGKKGIGKGLVE